jgi:CheY-like chemotaxis protein
LEVRTCDLVTIARDAVDVIRPAASSKRISIEVSAEDDAIRLVADPERLQQVIWNLLSNAIKFSDAGGKIMIRVTRGESNVVLSVTDTGKGIDASFLPFVFDRFRQADATMSRTIGGLGLGLAIVRHIVELHGGRATVASEGLGTSATFTITLPVAAVSPSVSHRSTKSQPDEDHRLEPIGLDGVRVLVIDDDADARDLISFLLTDAGAVVDTAGSAAEGFERFQQSVPEVLVSDIGMPEEDGFSLMRRIRALPVAKGGRVASMALTAFASETDRNRAVGAGYRRISASRSIPRY